MAWRVKEDVALMSSWCFVSEDKISGRNQKTGSLWGRVHEMFQQAHVENPEEVSERNKDSLKGRWKRLSENANKWIAAYREAYSCKRSGMSLKDVEKEAHSIYEACGSKFQDLVVFNEVMSKHPKWELICDRDPTRFRSENIEENEERGGSSKRARTSEDQDFSIPCNAETPSTDCSTISRPTGRDKAKKKGKGKTTQSSSSTEIAAEIRALRLTRASEVEVIHKRIEMDREKMQMDREKMQMDAINMNKNMLNTLLAKDHLTPKEEEMRDRLMAMVFGN